MGYYFISVGGSGTRVLESVSHLCVAGLLPNKNGEGHFYAMSIDPDTGNGNLTRTNTLLNCLDRFQNVQVGKGTPLLKTPLKLATPSFNWSPVDLGRKLDDVTSYTHFAHMPIGKLYESLYTKEERMTILDEGFRGRPSIGAMVMGMQATANVQTAWNNFINDVNSDVRIHGSAQIFLAGSIFGGTGAAGLPTIARLLRQIFNTHIQTGKVRIGGALLLPYFSFAPSEDQRTNIGLFASADNFLTNTKAALRYYADTSESGYDSMYFIGDETMLPMPNFSIGAATQRNDAHIVDFFAAMAAVHFYSVNDGRHCYYISRNNEDEFKWEDLPDVEMYDGTKVSVKERLAQFVRFIFAYLHIVKPVLPRLVSGQEPINGYPWYKDYWLKNNIDINSNEVRNFQDYAEQFVIWLDQVEHSTGTRSVELINPKAFRIKNNRAEIDPDLFSTLDYDNSNLSIAGVRTYMAKGEGKVIFGRHFGGHRQIEGTNGFGLFLRRLYDSCKETYK